MKSRKSQVPTILAVTLSAILLSGCAQLVKLTSLGGLADLISGVSEQDVRDLWAQWQRLHDIISPTNSAGTAANALPTIDAIPDQRVAAWFEGGDVRCMNVGALNNSPEYVQSIIDREKAAGANTAWIIAANTGDGAPVPTTIYEGSEYGGAISKDRLAQFRSVISMHRAAGLRIVLWITTDDSKPIYTATRDQHLAHVTACISNLDDLVDEYCIGLEMDSDGRKDHALAMRDKAKSLTKKRVGVHLNKGQWEDAIAWKADVLYYQHGPETDPTAAALEFAQVLKDVAGRCAVVAAEFHLSADSAQAKAVGAAIAAVPGCAGTGSGRK